MESKFILRNWIIAYASGELIGIAFAAIIALSASCFLGEPVTFGLILLHILTFILSGLIEGGISGYLMWRVLRY